MPGSETTINDCDADLAAYFSNQIDPVVLRNRRQAAACFPLWREIVRQKQCPTSQIAVDRGISLSQTITTELDVARWVWPRLRDLPANLFECFDVPRSLRWIAKTIETMGPAAKPLSPAAFAVLRYHLWLDDLPNEMGPNRMSIAVRQGLQRDAAIKEWPAITRNLWVEGAGSTMGPGSATFAMFAYVLTQMLISASLVEVPAWDKDRLEAHSRHALGDLFRGVGLERLVEYCNRWKRDVSRAAADGASSTSVEPLLGEVQLPLGVIGKELCREADLIEEAQVMQHCVADFWPLVALRRAAVFSMIDRGTLERATVYLKPTLDLRWQVAQCVGFQSTPDISRKLKACSQELSVRLAISLRSATDETISACQRAANCIARYSPAGGLYTDVTNATELEFTQMRRWFPCGRMSPTDRLRQAWLSAQNSTAGESADERAGY